MKTFLIIVFSCLAGFVQAQQKVNVSLSDGKSGSALKSVSITTGKRVLAITDSSGNAVLTLLPGNYNLTFSITGYEAKDTLVTIPGTERLIIAMTEEETSLEEVLLYHLPVITKPWRTAP